MSCDVHLSFLNTRFWMLVASITATKYVPLFQTVHLFISEYTYVSAMFSTLLQHNLTNLALDDAWTLVASIIATKSVPLSP